ncbi:uncharacterized protein PV09_01277 [Verruconis gallopava]|uniref:CHCH domain-containing protein n=1 Tax=Verruconis gallopava TaxID=253628 RepID=A0A0D1XZX3_9PEZI|nr:uncharacterized protein PV09_01277 [Verruconis gallopava]KIW08361.1 hypothetical protein PV09_01277 [Verruconis gallopava]
MSDVKEVRNDAKASVADDEPDDWDKRIFSTGCAAENMKMTDCYYETKDWRACKKEMEEFRECWKRNGNIQRTSQKDA